MYKKQSNKHHHIIDYNRIAQVQAVFEKKHWHLDNPNYAEVFDRYCKMLQCFSNEQQDFILKLSKSFLWVEAKDYIRLFYDVFEQVISSIPENHSGRILLSPLVISKGIRPKSAQILLYMIDAGFYPANYPQYTIELVPSHDILLKNVKTNDIVCLFDDFIGTGEQAVKSITTLINSGQIHTEQVAVLALVAQNIGVDLCKRNGIKVYYHHYRMRAISDIPDNCEINTCLMNEIERIVNPPSKYNFGKGRTEALVKLIHTPNNTFPVFWYSNDDSYPCCPFPRKPFKENIK